MRDELVGVYMVVCSIIQSDELVGVYMVVALLYSEDNNGSNSTLQQGHNT